MEFTELKCRNCQKRLLIYMDNGIRRYKNPVGSCKKCKTKYLDPRCHEIAIEGIPGDTFSVKSYTVMMVIGALILWRGIYLLGTYQLGTPDGMQWLLPVVFIIGGAVMVIGGIVEIIMIKTGKKAQRFERLRKESEARLKDRSYVYTLKGLGYNVSDNYL